ncbi:hypothetical protein [Pontibacter sp. SGAir0037]|uniref:hypothetical protein n=1 Tax=Pontibacter sp. SGAir0037 TaxID=2571030 RepID=UPI0010CCBB6A|nr:hypothetical protein [Pontibacter sp. SGAir0037]QCR25024.1 hypothetical protein C1N53_11135 [Pontibacter sp. SGAir0037]
MKLSKIYNPQEMNSYQFVAATGFIMSLVAHIIILFIGKTIDNFEALYICWTAFFILGTIANLRDDNQNGGHHHHH